jgi:hypothetical protein
VNRRDFTRLAAAALGGVVAGAKLAAAEDKPKKKDVEKPMLLQEPNVCRGLNTCKGKGKGGKNDCAGMGQCATAKAHSCGGDNDCAGLGGCGEHPGENKCKGMGKCQVPLDDKAWKKAREHFEAAMKKADKKFGEAPKKEK